MKRRRLPQQTPKELLDTLLDFLQRKFYENDATSFRKDRSRLLSWVVLWPASWLTERGVSLPADRYRELFFKVLMDAQANGTEKIKYRPAWLKMVVQSHFAHHGDEIYEQAKSMRSLVEHAFLMAGKANTAPPDPTDDFDRARKLVVTSPRRPKKQADNDQLTLI